MARFPLPSLVCWGLPQISHSIPSLCICVGLLKIKIFIKEAVFRASPPFKCSRLSAFLIQSWHLCSAFQVLPGHGLREEWLGGWLGWLMGTRVRVYLCLPTNLPISPCLLYPGFCSCWSSQDYFTTDPFTHMSNPLLSEDTWVYFLSAISLYLFSDFTVTISAIFLL